MSEPVFEITKAARFDAAHSLPQGPRGEYRRLHGHSFTVEATVRGPMLQPVDWVVDLGAGWRAPRSSGCVCTSPSGWRPTSRASRA